MAYIRKANPIQVPSTPEHPEPNQTAKRGDYTPIYADPITRTKLEGIARLGAMMKHDPAGLDDFFVRFVGDDSDVRRTIYRY